MVAIINTGHAVRNSFTYNENKVRAGVASCIGEGNYPMDLGLMTPESRLGVLLKRVALNPRVTRNSVHISLNFDPTEKALHDERYREIAHAYMKGIGFGEQPYLIYRHEDAAHPHLHIVSVKIRPDGSRIDMHNIGRNQSEKTRKELEARFGLVAAQSKMGKASRPLTPITAARVAYGVSQTRQAIANVLNAILPHYAYSSVAELNAVLRLYNVTAETGSEESRLRRHKGVLYQVIDTNGRPIGLPVKASRFFSKPTYAYLERRFEQGKLARRPYATRLKNLIDAAFLRPEKPSLAQLATELQKAGVDMVERRNAEGLLFGLTYVDHKNKTVFNGSTLGKPYSAKAMLERSGSTVHSPNKKSSFVFSHQYQEIPYSGIVERTIRELTALVDQLLSPVHQSDYTPGAVSGKKKKKKRRGQGSSDKR